MIEKLTNSKNNKIQHIYSSEEPYVIEIDVYCESVYSITYGKIVYIGKFNNRYVVNVQCNRNEIIRYGNLKRVNVEVTQTVSIGQLIGIPDKFVQFEYCTLWKGNSVNPVRVNTNRYYKQDPTDILNGSYTVPNEPAVEFKASRAAARVSAYSKDQESEFGNNRGD